MFNTLKFFVRPKLTMRFNCFLIIGLICSACMPKYYPAGETITQARMTNNAYLTNDGVQLPLTRWEPEKPAAQAIIIAVHGFNDYSRFFNQAATFLQQHQVLSFAYDQRGFGGSPNRGLWAGKETYVNDLHVFVQTVSRQYPTTPIYLLGASMGGAVVISTISHAQPLPIAGAILVAPAVWDRSSMPWYQTALLSLLSHTTPWMTLTGGSLEIIPSDNIEMLRAFSKDPLIIKETRVESIYGVTNLMDLAMSRSEHINTPTLFLYGEKDEIIPKQPTLQFLQKMQKTDKTDQQIAFYENGFHMLLRDLQAETVWLDIVDWIKSRPVRLSSGADQRALEILSN